MMMMDKVLFYFTSAIRFVRALIGKKEEGGREKKKILRRFERNQMAGWLND